MKLAHAALAAALVLPARGAAAADLPIDGITVGSSVRVLAQTLGAPSAVSSDDSGNRFVFASGATAYADDDGIVLAIDAQSGSPQVDVDGTVRAFPIGAYSTARADADLADVAEFATPTLRSYRLSPRRDLVLRFAAASNRLERLAYGEPGQLARLGLLPGDAAAKAVAYRAPALRRSLPEAAPTSTRAGVYRVAVDRAGTVRGVDIVVPCDLPGRDADLAGELLGDRYAPATLDGRPIAATIFVERYC